MTEAVAAREDRNRDGASDIFDPLAVDSAREDFLTDLWAYDRTGSQDTMYRVTIFLPTATNDGTNIDEASEMFRRWIRFTKSTLRNYVGYIIPAYELVGIRYFM